MRNKNNNKKQQEEFGFSNEGKRNKIKEEGRWKVRCKIQNQEIEMPTEEKERKLQSSAFCLCNFVHVTFQLTTSNLSILISAVRMSLKKSKCIIK